MARPIPLEKFHFDVTVLVLPLPRGEVEEGRVKSGRGGIEGKRRHHLGRRVTLYVSVEHIEPPFQTPPPPLLVRFASNCNIFTPGAQSTLMQSCLWNIVCLGS